MFKYLFCGDDIVFCCFDDFSCFFYIFNDFYIIVYFIVILGVVVDLDCLFDGDIVVVRLNLVGEVV